MITRVLHCGEVGGQPLLLVPPGEKHVEQAFSWLTNPRLTRLFMLGWDPTIEAYRDLLKSAPIATDRYSWMVQLGSTHVGLTGVRGLDRTGTVRIGEPFILVAPEHQNRGIATQVMRQQARFMFGPQCRLDYLHVCILKTNTASLRVVKKVGYQRWCGSPELRYKVGKRYFGVWQGYLAASSYS